MASDSSAAVDAVNTQTNASSSPLATGALTPAAALNQLDQSVISLLTRYALHTH